MRRTPMREFLHGPIIVDWLYETGEFDHLREQFGHTFMRTAYRWKHEQPFVSIYALDRYLTHTDLLEHDIPEEAWAEVNLRRRGGRPHSPETKAKAIELRRQGVSQNEIGRELGCDPRSVRNWMREAA